MTTHIRSFVSLLFNRKTSGIQDVDIYFSLNAPLIFPACEQTYWSIVQRTSLKYKKYFAHVYVIFLLFIFNLEAKISLSQISYTGSEASSNVEISLNVVGQLETTVIARFVIK